MDITISPDGPCDPGYVLELAGGLAEIVRALNSLTRHHQALEFPAEADQLLRFIETAALRLPQLLQQVAVWLEAERAGGRIAIADGEYAGNPAFATVAAHIHLDAAAVQAEALRAEVASAAAVTAHMAAAEDGSDEGSGP